jgi:hypothetical protein
MRNIADKLVEKIKTHILCSVTSTPHPPNRAVCEIMWKNVMQLGGPQKTIWCVRIACRITEATNAQSEYVIIKMLFFPQQQWLRERATMLRVYANFILFFFFGIFSRFQWLISITYVLIDRLYKNLFLFF